MNDVWTTRSLADGAPEPHPKPAQRMDSQSSPSHVFHSADFHIPATSHWRNDRPKRYPPYHQRVAISEVLTFDAWDFTDRCHRLASIGDNSLALVTVTALELPSCASLARMDAIAEVT